jgi:hypothetical protein
MTSEQVAQGQLWAAWVQAAGVIAGMFASLWIAINAERRAARAERAAADRELAAERAADRRARKLIVDAHNGLVRETLALTDQAVKVLESEVSRWRNERARSNFVGAGRSPGLRTVLGAFATLPVGATHDVDLKQNIATLRLLVDGDKRRGSAQGGEAQHWAQYYAEWLAELQIARASVACSLLADPEW